MQSTEFEILCKNIRSLKSTFLDFNRRDDGDYTQPERMKCRAFIAFAHAEFEHYLESLSLRILQEAINKWQNDREVSYVAAAVLAYRRRDKITVPDDLKQINRSNTLGSILMQAFDTQKKVISRNSGIKPKNFSAIYTPLGVMGEDVEEALLIQLGNTGVQRGDLVHTGANISLPTIRDPFVDEEKDVNFLVSELKKFDTKLLELNFYTPQSSHKLAATPPLTSP